MVMSARILKTMDLKTTESVEAVIIITGIQLTGIFAEILYKKQAEG